MKSLKGGKARAGEISELGVWEYMDPDTNNNPQKIHIAQLDETELKRFRLLKKDYREDLREYKEKEKEPR